MTRAADPDHPDTAEPVLYLPDLCAPNAVLTMVVSVELFVVVIMLGAFGLRGFSWEFLAVTSMLGLWIVLTSAAILCPLRARLLAMSRNRGMAVCMLVILGTTFVFSLPADWVAQGMPETGIYASLDGYNVLRNLLIAALVAGMLLRYAQVQASLRQREHIEMEQRYRALQARIRPHFLFNSMNTLASLVRADAELAETVIEDLSELFRATLRDELRPVPFAAERALCESYLRIEQLRLGERLQVDWSGMQVPDDVPIPLLTLQQLVENAVYHGIQPRTEGGTVRLLGQLQAGRVELEVSNPLPGQPMRRSGNRMALDNIRHRLQVAFGGSSSLTATEGEGLFRVRLSYPVHVQGGVSDA